MDMTNLFAAPPKVAVAEMKHEVAVSAKDKHEQSDKKTETKEERIAREREQLESRLAAGELDDTRTRVAYVLNPS
jgi:protein involved in temperature-dependent protein secretion